MTREEIHKNVLTIRNYYFSIQNKIDNGYNVSELDIDSKTHNNMIDDTIKSAFEDHKIILALENTSYEKKDIDEGYIVGDFYIVKSPIKEGWLHVVNIKTSWQIKVMMGANTAKFLSLSQQEIFDRINGIYIQSMMSLYDSEYALKIAKDAVSYMSKKAKRWGILKMKILKR